MAFHRTLRFRIVVASAALSALIVTVVSVYVLRDARDRAIEVLETRVTEQAELIASSFPARLAGAPIADLASQSSGARVTVLDSEGEIVEDSHSFIGERPSLANRPEIDTALASGLSLSRGSDPVLGAESVIAIRLVEVDGVPDAFVRVALPISDADDSIENLRTTAIVGGVLVVVVATVFATLLSARLTRSIGTVTEGARLVAAGNLEYRLRPEPPLEVEQLATAVNEMAARLNGLIALEGRERGRIQSILSAMSDGVLVVDAEGTVELANPAALAILDGPAEFEPGGPLYALNRNYELNQIALNSAVAGESAKAEIDFLDSRRYVQVLAVPLPKTASDGEVNRSLVLLTDLTEMRRVETTRREFISNASHELRTPVAAISAAVETLQAGAVDEADTAREFLQRIADDTARMDTLIAQMLELSRLETGQAQLSLTPIDPATVIKQATDRIAAQASRAGIRVVSEVPGEVPAAREFHADQDRVVEALTNLLVNALRASSRGSRIDISASSDGDNMTFRVTDEGRGIDSDHLPHIFERFYKGDSSRSDAGAGLGLAIVKHIMEAHGGRVEVESSLGEGATFRLIFSSTLPGA